MFTGKLITRDIRFQANITTPLIAFFSGKALPLLLIVKITFKISSN